MANTVLLKRSNTANAVPLAANLTAGELALNYTDGNLFYKNNAGDVVLIASNQTLSVTGNITGGNISAVGNISGTYFIGNGSLLTGISASGSGNAISNGTSNVIIPTANGSIYLSDDGVPNAAVFSNGSFTMAGSFATPKTTTANSTVTSNVNAMLLGPVSIGAGTTITVPSSSTLSIYTEPTAYSNTNVATYLASGTDTSNIITTANISGGNILTTGIVSATGNITGGNIVGSTLSVTGTTTNSGINSGGVTTGTALIAAGGRSSGSTGALLYLGGNSNPSGTSGYLMNGQHTLSPQQDLTSWYGLLFLPTVSTFSGNIGSMYNEFLRLDTTATGNANITNWFGSFVATPSFTVGSAPVVNTWVGYYVQDPNNAVVNPTTAYAFRSNVNRAANRWGAYFPGTANNYFAGNVGIGVTSAGNALDVSGTVYVTSGNVLTTGLVSATGNVTGGNITTAGIVSSLGNIQTSNSVVYANTTSVAKAYQTYNSATSSIDTVFL